MRICLLTTQELDADPFPEDDWPCDPRPFLPDAEWHLEVLERDTAVQRVIHLAREGFDIFFNLCDGAWDEASPGVEVIRALERLNVPFTGASSTFYEPTREAMKHACRTRGLDFPAFVMARDGADIERAAETLRFPLIVKHPSSYASIDLTEESRVTNPDALRTLASSMIERHTAALIEEFIEGEECTVLVVEDAADRTSAITYTPVRYKFPEGQSFKHHAMKWVDYDAMRCLPVEDPELSARLRAASSAFFVALGGRGFGRVDMRIDSAGRIFILEMNPNCGIYYPESDAGSADLCLLHDSEGHVGFTERLVSAALAAHERKRRPWRVLPSTIDGFGLIASQSIQPGECLVPFAGQPHELVSLRARRAELGEPDDWFYRSAWPLTDDLWFAWGHDPEQWCPINHSCEPNAWLNGWDVVARTPIAPGTEVTIDYATVHDERMPQFACRCGTDRCRGDVRGEDYLESVVDRYGDHLSDHIRARREAARQRFDSATRMRAEPAPGLL